MTTGKDDYGHSCSEAMDCTLPNIHCSYPECAKGKRIGIHAITKERTMTDQDKEVGNQNENLKLDEEDIKTWQAILAEDRAIGQTIADAMEAAQEIRARIEMAKHKQWGIIAAKYNLDLTKYVYRIILTGEDAVAIEKVGEVPEK